MDELRRWRERLRGFFNPDRVEREVAEEMAHHVELETRERIARGMSPAEARRTALRDFGGIERYRSEAREGRWGHGWEVLRRDLRYALRTLHKDPTSTTAAILSLALGIGAATTVVSVVDSVLLRPLPYPSSEQVVAIRTSWHQMPRASISPAEYLDYRDRLEAFFTAVGVYSFGASNVTGEGEPERVLTAFLTPGVFSALGIQPVLGRSWSEEEDRASASVAVVSDRFWRQRLGGDPAAVGGTLRVDGEEVLILGVLPPGFRLPHEVLSGPNVGLFVPQGIDPAQVTSRGSHYLSGVARVRPEAGFDQARTAFETLVAGFAQEHPADYTPDERFEATVVALAEDVRGPVRRPLLVLLGAVGFVLLITCVNVANLLLVRGERRERELALRTALGAARRRIVAQLLAEGGVLALAGGALGVLLAVAATRALATLAPRDLPWLASLELEPRGLAAAFALTLVTALLCGLYPALRGGRLGQSAALKEGGRSSTGSVRSQRARRWLTVAEVAIAMLLLAGAGLLTRSFWGLLQVDPGFRTAEVTTTRLSLPMADFRDDAAIVSFYRELVARLAQSPGVVGAGAVTNLPLATRLGDMGFEIEGRPIPPHTRPPAADWQVVTPGYFRAIGIPVLRGREIEGTDRADTSGAVVINETFATLHWPGESPLGRRLKLGGERIEPRWVEVVGVVGDVRHESLAAERRPQMYLAHEQFRLWTTGRAMGSLTLVAHSALPPAEVRAAITAAVRAQAGDLPLADFRTMTEVRRAAVALPRLLVMIVASFALVALVLAGVGIYGVVSATVSQRRGELAIRQALGARPGQLARMLLGQGLRMAGVGIALGLAGALLLGRALAGLLYGVEPGDPWTLAAVAVLLTAIALAACHAPLRRMRKVDPAQVLRGE